MEDQPKPNTTNVEPLGEVPWRYTPDMCVRMMLCRIDQLEDVAIFYRIRGKRNPIFLKSDGWTLQDYLSFSALLFKEGSANLSYRDPPDDGTGPKIKA